MEIASRSPYVQDSSPHSTTLRSMPSDLAMETKASKRVLSIERIEDIGIISIASR